MTSLLPSAAARSGLVLRPDFARAFAELVPAVLLHHLLVSNDLRATDLVEHLVDRMLLPLIVQAQPRPTPAGRDPWSTGVRSVW